jgi:hypothetical protein
MTACRTSSAGVGTRQGFHEKGFMELGSAAGVAEVPYRKGTDRPLMVLHAEFPPTGQQIGSEPAV